MEYGQLSPALVWQSAMLLVFGALLGSQFALIRALSARWVAALIVLLVAAVAIYLGWTLPFGARLIGLEVLNATMIYCGCTWVLLALAPRRRAATRI